MLKPLIPHGEIRIMGGVAHIMSLKSMPIFTAARAYMIDIRIESARSQCCSGLTAIAEQKLPMLLYMRKYVLLRHCYSIEEGTWLSNPGRTRDLI